MKPPATIPESNHRRAQTPRENAIKTLYKHWSEEVLVRMNTSCRRCSYIVYEQCINVNTETLTVSANFFEILRFWPCPSTFGKTFEKVWAGPTREGSRAEAEGRPHSGGVMIDRRTGEKIAYARGLTDCGTYWQSITDATAAARR